MDGQPVSSDSSIKDFSFKKFFDEWFPYYLYLGMTYDEFYRMDCTLVKAYRRAYEYKKEYDNSLLWLQGMYVYDAMEAQRSGWAFYSGKPIKPEKYLEKPKPVTKSMREQYAIEQTQMMAAHLRAAFHKHNNRTPAITEEGENNGS